MRLPVPSHWQDFETITRDALAQSWSSPNLQKNGRPGQAQHGVDIYGYDNFGRPVGVQCKRFKKELRFSDVEAEVKNAATFQGKLTTLFMATTCDFDATLQQRVRAYSEQRATSGVFAVGILFWEDIIAGLVMNPGVFNAHYPQLQMPHSSAVDRDRRIAALEMGYYGAELWAYVELIFGEYGWLANADPDELFANLRVIEHRAQQLLSPDDASQITDPLSELHNELKKTSTAPDWMQVRFLANRVSQRCRSASSLLGIDEAKVLDIACQLSTIYHHLDSVPSKAKQDLVKKKVVSLLNSDLDEITRIFLEAAELDSGYGWAMRIYSLLAREIRFG